MESKMTLLDKLESAASTKHSNTEFRRNNDLNSFTEKEVVKDGNATDFDI